MCVSGWDWTSDQCLSFPGKSAERAPLRPPWPLALRVGARGSPRLKRTLLLAKLLYLTKGMLKAVRSGIQPLADAANNAVIHSLDLAPVRAYHGLSPEIEPNLELA